MITKERLEELLEENSTIYTTYGGYVSEINLDFLNDYIEGNYLFEANLVAQEINHIQYTFNILFEKKEDAEWVVKHHTTRTEYFEPPFKLEPYDEYVFYCRRWGRVTILNDECIEKTPYHIFNKDCWLNEWFKTYEEAVEFARKLFRGEDV